MIWPILYGPCYMNSINYMAHKKLKRFKKFIKCLQSYKIYGAVILKYRGILLWGYIQGPNTLWLFKIHVCTIFIHCSGYVSDTTLTQCGLDSNTISLKSFLKLGKFSNLNWCMLQSHENNIQTQVEAHQG